MKNNPGIGRRAINAIKRIDSKVIGFLKRTPKKPVQNAAGGAPEGTVEAGVMVVEFIDQKGKVYQTKEMNLKDKKTITITTKDGQKMRLSFRINFVSPKKDEDDFHIEET